MAPFGHERVVQQFGRVRARILAASSDQRGEQRERQDLLTSLLHPAQLPTSATSTDHIAAPGTEWALEDRQKLPDSPRASQLSGGTLSLPSTLSLRLLCSENFSDDQSRPQAHSLANLRPTTDRPPVAPPGQARHSPPPFSLRPHTCLPKTGTARWGKPTRRSRAARLSSTLSGVTQ